MTDVQASSGDEVKSSGASKNTPQNKQAYIGSGDTHGAADEVSQHLDGIGEKLERVSVEGTDAITERLKHLSQLMPDDTVYVEVATTENPDDGKCASGDVTSADDPPAVPCLRVGKEVQQMYKITYDALKELVQLNISAEEIVDVFERDNELDILLLRAWVDLTKEYGLEYDKKLELEIESDIKEREERKKKRAETVKPAEQGSDSEAHNTVHKEEDEGTPQEESTLSELEQHVYNIIVTALRTFIELKVCPYHVIEALDEKFFYQWALATWIALGGKYDEEALGGVIETESDTSSTWSDDDDDDDDIEELEEDDKKPDNAAVEEDEKEKGSEELDDSNVAVGCDGCGQEPAACHAEATSAAEPHTEEPENLLDVFDIPCTCRKKKSKKAQHKGERAL